MCVYIHIYRERERERERERGSFKHATLVNPRSAGRGLKEGRSRGAEVAG